ncbi:unnamed protein product [Darwinula stevensoni]|uniref:G-protein coupled receptors family 1 profile domain-containing protein n=1 Tax=Darwinula stevensoni TaxID=69355 RepID=A0A7R8X665_9CRUS|nr:unnamed protein product [Darwinula stevensoni]CAG0879121.1 unnamed protein product [Darwinula stevensoni]
MPAWEQALWTLLFAGMVLVAAGGNLIVIWIVLAHRRMRTVTNYFIVNLAVADTIVSTLNVIFSFVYMLNSHWPFGWTYCKICQFVAVLSVAGSVFTLVAIALDRFTAIMKPLKPRMGRKATLGVIVLIWTMASIVSLPMFIFATTTTLHYQNGDMRVLCYTVWPDGASAPSYHEYIYNVVFMVVTYFLPIAVMIYTYSRVGMELWGSQAIGEATQRQNETIHSKRKVVKMMIFIVLAFAICWLPYHVYFIVISVDPGINDLPYIQELYLAIYWLAMSNSMYNPMIYCWRNQRFRRGFKIVFRFLPCVHVTEAELALDDRKSLLYTARYNAGENAHCRINRNGISTGSRATLTTSTSLSSGNVRRTSVPVHCSAPGTLPVPVHTSTRKTSSPVTGPTGNNILQKWKNGGTKPYNV